MRSFATRHLSIVAAVESGGNSAALSLGSARSIRTQIPTRPEVTVLLYLDSHGTQSRHNRVTNISLVRTRDNKFWLQRVLPGGETIRWRAVGLDVMKHATSFESYNICDIDENGGIVIPTEVRPTCQGDPLSFFDAICTIQKMQSHAKFTRKDRRQWHRRSFAHWSETPEKYATHILGSYGVLGIIVLWVVVRASHAYTNNKSFWDNDVYTKGGEREYETIKQINDFAKTHPEHEISERKMVPMSPGMDKLGGARAELRESDYMDPHSHSELWWKLRHAYYYGHWPKGLKE